MKKIYLLLTLFSFGTLVSKAQLNESFADGNFTAGTHVWTGSTLDWIVVPDSDVAAGATGSNTLRLAGPNSAGTRYLSTQLPGSWALGQTWGFWMGRRGQAVTDLNRSYFWLYANEADVTSLTVDGYRISLGDDAGNDEFRLERILDGAVANTVITGLVPVTTTITDWGILVRVTRSSIGVWSMFTSTVPTTSGTGAIATDFPNITNTTVSQGSATDNTISNFTGGYVAVAALHTTTGQPRAGAEFDQIRVAFDANAPLPVKLGSIKAYEKQAGVQIDWTAYSEENLSKYQVERSADGVTFTALGNVTANNSLAVSNYGFFDTNPMAGVNFYRLKSIDADGKFAYSSIVRVNLDKNVKGITVYPNPVTNGYVSFQSADLAKGNYTVKLFTATGQQVYSQRFAHSGGAINQTIQLPNGTKSGMYSIQLDNDAVKVMTKTFIVQ